MRINYLTELKSLVRSIVLKSSHQAEAINKNIINTYGINYVSNDYKTWRYYLNLNGQYHFTNEEMEVHVLETNTTMPLTKELLAKFKKTREELSRCQINYKKLVKRYPNNELLIKGMINPVEMEEAYNAKDGVLLSYSKIYADINDVGVLRKLSKYTESIYYRWFNPFYIEMEEFSIQTFLAYLYSNLYTKIDLIRMENIHTHKVHPYHMEYFFRSHLDIDTRYLNKKSKMWLYQNLRAVMTNNGKSETFKQILDNVITPNEVGVGKVNINKTKPRLINTDNNIKPNFTTDSINQIIVNNMNEHYYIDGMTLSEVTSIEIKNGYIHETQYMDVNELVERVKRKIDKNNEINLETKVIHLLGKEDRDILPFPRLNVVLDNLFHIGSKSICDFDLKFIDPNNNITYSITMIKAIRLLGCLLLRYCNKEAEEITIASKSVFNDNDIDIYRLMIPDYSSYKYIKRLDEIRPFMNSEYFNPIDLTKYITDGIDYFIMEWLIKSSLVNQISIANMDVLNLHKCYDEFDLYIGDIVNEIGLDLSDGYNYLDSIKGLIYSISGGSLILDLNEVTTGAIHTYIDLLNKTTSYNIQIIGSTTSSNSLHMFDVGMGELNGPVIVTVSGYINGLEELKGDMNVGYIPRVVTNIISDNDYLHKSDMTPMNGGASDLSTMIPVRYDLLDTTKERGILSTILSDGKYMNMNNITPMNGGASDLSTMIRNVVKETINIEGGVLYAGASFRLELKKESNDLEKTK